MKYEFFLKAVCVYSEKMLQSGPNLFFSEQEKISILIKKKLFLHRESILRSVRYQSLSFRKVFIGFYLDIQKTKVTELLNLQKVNLQKENIQNKNHRRVKYTET